MRGGYITEDAFQKREGRKKRKKKENGCSSYHPWKLSPLSTKKSRRRRISPRTKPEDKLLPFPRAFDHSISIWSCPAVGALTKAQFLSPFSLPNLLYQAVGFGLIRLREDKTPRSPLIAGAWRAQVHEVN